GITGSVGKTSTKEMIYYVLSQKYKTLKTQGNLNNEIGLPMTLLNLDRSYQAAVIEMGMSNRGEISRLSLTACPNIGVITNIGVSHIENLGSRENILKAKLEILDGIIDDSPIVLNADDDMLSTVDEFLQREIIFYGINNPEADIRAVDIVQQNMTTEFDIVYYGNKVKARIPAIGIHNVYNALAAFCVGLIGEVDVADIIKGIASYKPAGMRQNVVVKEGVTVIEDCYNASPDSMKAALNVLSEIDTQGKRFAVLGDMLELGEVSEKLHFDVGVLASESKADVLVCYGEQARHIAQGAVSNGMTNVLAFDDKEDVSNYLKQNVKFGDAVLFKASRGMKLEEVILQTYGES
ncbi:MAG: murF, partial [Oscillospiraceae bacterium]|nr:murF [Oscillospiraceae bacterium]